jgi:hypothetical protein
MKKGDRVELHPATDDWMRGDRYGEVVGFGRAREYKDTFTGKINRVVPVLVKLDKSGKKKRFHPENVTLINSRSRKKTARKNPRSARARRQKKSERAYARSRSEPVRMAKRRIAIKRQIRRAGYPVHDPNAPTRKLRAARREITPRPGYQIAAYSISSGKVAYWAGHGFTLLRGDAINYPTVREALRAARRQGNQTRLAVASSATSAKEIEMRLLTGIRLPKK